MLCIIIFDSGLAVLNAGRMSVCSSTERMVMADILYPVDPLGLVV